MLGRILALFCLWFAGTAWAVGWKTPREALDRRLASADFFIFYTLEGSHAFPWGTSASERHTHATAYLEALVTQLSVADNIYRHHLGLRPPLSSKRYATARSIDIHIMRLEGKTGSTGDEIHAFRYRHFPPSPAALAIALDQRWQPTNLTPAHELFHAYQYSYTFFKNAWFLEGLARASEGFFRTTPRQPVPLPANREALEEIIDRSYKAETLWNRLILLCGRKILRPLLENYGRLDHEAARARGFDPSSWPEEEQRAKANNPYLLRGLMEAIETHCPAENNTELQEFKALLKQQYRSQ